MKLLKVLMILALVFGAHSVWKHPELWSAQGGRAEARAFIDAAMPQGAPPDTVVILAPRNCPSEAAQRADNLARELARMGIPHVRQNEYSAHFVDATPEQEAALQRAVAVLQGEIPAVFVNGRAKANPKAEEVAAEFQRPR